MDGEILKVSEPAVVMLVGEAIFVAYSIMKKKN
jgi:hypothetical protein